MNNIINSPKKQTNKKNLLQEHLMVSALPRINKTPDCMRDKAIKEIKLMRSAIQVKHAENKQLQNKQKQQQQKSNHV